MTSGCQSDCLKGIDLIHELALEAKSVRIVPAGGIKEETVSYLLSDHIREFHVSGKIQINSPVIYRNDNVSMGIIKGKENITLQSSTQRLLNYYFGSTEVKT